MFMGSWVEKKWEGAAACKTAALGGKVRQLGQGVEESRRKGSTFFLEFLPVYTFLYGMAKTKQNNPQPIRFDDEEQKLIAELQKATSPKMSVSQIVRRAARFALPKMLSGEVPLIDHVAKPAVLKTLPIGR